MREYRTREEAERDPNLNLMIIWRCSKCGTEQEEPPNCNEGGGIRQKAGETYNT